MHAVSWVTGLFNWSIVIKLKNKVAKNILTSSILGFQENQHRVHRWTVQFQYNDNKAIKRGKLISTNATGFPFCLKMFHLHDLFQ